MPRLLVLHPNPTISEPWRHAVLALGCPADVTHDRDTALRWLLRASRAGQLGMLLIVDDSPVWRARDIVRDMRRLPLRRQVPVLVMSPAAESAHPDSEPLYPASACVSPDVAPSRLLMLMALLMGRSTKALYRLGALLPGGRPWHSESEFRARLQTELAGLWQSQQMILTQARVSAGGVAAARQVLEYLLANRLDPLAVTAACELPSVPGGPRPIAQWAARWAPQVSSSEPCTAPCPIDAERLPTSKRRTLLLRLGGWQVGVPIERTGRAFWWDPQAATSQVIDASDAGSNPTEPNNVALSDLLATLDDLPPPTAGLWLELWREGEQRVVTSIDDVIAYATLDCNDFSPDMRQLTGLSGTTRAADGSEVLLPDLTSLLQGQRQPASQRPA